MENTEKITWDEFKEKSNKELKEKDAPYRLIPIWFLIISWLAIITLMAFLVSIPILAYNGKFQSLINNTINLDPEINNNVTNHFDNDYNPTTNNQYKVENNFTIHNVIILPESLNCSCNCS